MFNNISSFEMQNNCAFNNLGKPIVTIGFTSHRIESLCFATRLMATHDVIIIEEAPNPRFINMLERRTSINEYLKEEYMEFPEFSRRDYRVLRNFHRKGKEIMQIEPYLEKLMQIYELFYSGKGPSDVVKIPGMRAVYEAEMCKELMIERSVFDIIMNKIKEGGCLECFALIMGRFVSV